jgi:peptidoglycan/xylan/chitin deacetylase (PgdA/CDA1 family)
VNNVRLTLAVNALRWSGTTALLRKLDPWNGLLVLNYHRIGVPEATPFERNVFSARQEALERQVRFLKRSADVIAPADIPDALRAGRGLHILLTFDDGYRDNFDLAYPVLRAHSLPATFFICTGYIDDPRLSWWDEIAWILRTSEPNALPANRWFSNGLALDPPDHEAAIAEALKVYKRLPGEETAPFLATLREATGRDGRAIDGHEFWMSWEMVRELHAGGMTIGAHTVNHPLLGLLPVDEQAVEIAGSRHRLEEELGVAPDAFAYPVGSRTAFTADTKRLLAENGFRFGFSFYGGMQSFAGFDPYDIRRATVGTYITQPVFEAMPALHWLFARG